MKKCQVCYGENEDRAATCKWCHRSFTHRATKKFPVGQISVIIMAVVVLGAIGINRSCPADRANRPVENGSKGPVGNGNENAFAGKATPALQNPRRYSKKSTAAPKISNWYAGGNLHKATVAEWKESSASNRLATAADWVAANLKSEGRQVGDISELRAPALALERCVSEAALANGMEEVKVTELAAACLIILENQ